MTKEQEAMAREAAREWGKKGGRPRTAPHVEGWKGCRCAGCREKKVRGAQVDVKVGPHRESALPQQRERPASRVEARQEQLSPSGFESRALHQEEEVKAVPRMNGIEGQQVADVSVPVRGTDREEVLISRGKVDPKVAKLREVMEAMAKGKALVVAAEIKEAEGLRPGEMLVEDVEGTSIGRTMEAAKLNRKVAGLRQLADERWVVKVEWVKAQQEASLGRWEP